MPQNVDTRRGLASVTELTQKGHVVVDVQGLLREVQTIREELIWVREQASQAWDLLPTDLEARRTLNRIRLRLEALLDPPSSVEA